MNDLLYGVALPEYENRSGFMQRNAAGEQALGAVVVVGGVEGGGEIGQTVDTDLVLASHQHIAAAGAGAGKKGLDEVAEKGVHGCSG